jgi:AraC-like DNA-binding protein
MARYKQLTCPEEILQEKNDEEWSIQFRWLLADEVEPAVLIECAFAWVLSTGRHGSGMRLSPIRVEFMQPRAHAKVIERHFGCPIVFGTHRNAIVFRATDAQKPFVTRNAELLAMLAPQFEEELKQQNNKDENFAERVRIAIQQKLTGKRPTIDDIADVLHISSRTLQRRLQDEQCSYQRVLDEARHHLARHYLNNSFLELNEAAYLLGYEDGNSFVRAFRTWEGVPPARWREQQRAEAAS